MAVEAHAAIQFHDQGIEFVERHEVGHEALEVRNVVAAGEEQFDAPKRLVGPVANLRAGDGDAVLLLGEQLTERLQTVEGAAGVTSSDQR